MQTSFQVHLTFCHLLRPTHLFSLTIRNCFIEKADANRCYTITYYVRIGINDQLPLNFINSCKWSRVCSDVERRDWYVELDSQVCSPPLNQNSCQKDFIIHRFQVSAAGARHSNNFQWHYEKEKCYDVFDWVSPRHRHRWQWQTISNSSYICLPYNCWSSTILSVDIWPARKSVTWPVSCLVVIRLRMPQEL